MASAQAWRDSVVPIAGIELKVRRAGSGKPLVILHHDFGSPDSLSFYNQLAERYEVLLPLHPGFGSALERPEWMRSVRDLAVVYRCLLADLGIARPSLVGLGFGGWLAAEMASMAPNDIDKLVLVGAMGVQPEEGFILDQALVGYIDYARAAFHDQAAFDAVYGAEPSNDQLEEWDICREMCFRIAWKPYMFSHTLPHLLKSMRAETLVVWGEHDAVVPKSAGEIYAASLPNAEAVTVPACGHAVDMEKPDELCRLINDFVGAS